MCEILICNSFTFGGIGSENIHDEWFMDLGCENDLAPPLDVPAPPTTTDVSVLQDPQITRLASLNLQRAAENEFQNRGTSSKSTQDQDVQEKLKNMFDTLILKMNDDPDVYRLPIKGFVSRFEKISSDSALISALLTFAKYSTPSVTRQIRNRAKKCLQTSTKIGVQPTAVARRKAPLGGRRAVITGRPPKSSRQTEHGYAKQKTNTNSVKRGVLPKRNLPAPHSISKCATENTSLGRTHSAKL